MQVKKGTKLLYISSESEQEKQIPKTKPTDPMETEQSLKYKTFKTRAYKLQKNTMKGLPFEQEYIFTENTNEKHRDGQTIFKSVQFVSQNYFQLENHTISGEEQTPVVTQCKTEASILEKMESHKQKQQIKFNPEVIETEKQNETDELRRTTKSKKNIIEANFGTDSEDEHQSVVQIQNQQQKSSQNQNDGAIQQAKWEITTPRQIFAFQKVKETERLFLVLQRQSSGLNFFSPQFDLVLGNDPRIILSCKKKISTNLQCIISLDKNDVQQKSPHCIGKVVGNFKNSVFNVIDVRKNGIVCTTRFRDEQNVTIPTPKCYEIFYLNQMCEYSTLIGADEEKLSKGLDQLYMIPANRKYITCLRNKKPQFCAEIGAYMLNFSGRVKKGSVKNFIVEDPKSGRQILMFGKSVNDTFNIFISGPFSPFLALGVVIPNFTTKFIFK